MARSTSAVPMTERARSMSALGAPDRHPHGEHEVLRRGLTCIQALDIERTARVIALDHTDALRTVGAFAPAEKARELTVLAGG